MLEYPILKWTLIFDVVFFIMLYLAYRDRTNIKKLKKKGYTDDQIAIIRVNQKKVSLYLVTLLIIIQVILVAVFILVFGKDIKETGLIMKLAQLALCLIMIGTALVAGHIMTKKNKEMAIKTGSDIIIDFDYRILKLIFNYRLEIIASPLIIFLAAFKFKELILGLLYAFLPWFLFIVIRVKKIMIKRQFRDFYLLIAKVFLIYQALIIWFMVRGSIKNIESPGWSDILIVVLICGFLVVKFIYYILSYKRFKIEVIAVTE